MNKQKTLIILFSLLLSLSALCQPENDECINSSRLCSNQPLQGTTVDATLNTSTDLDFCTINSSTIWYQFTTNSIGGNVSIDFTAMSFNPDINYGQTIDAVIFEVGTPCNPATYIPRSICGNSGIDFSLLSATPLAANTTYYILINAGLGGGTNPSECSFTINMSGPAVDVLSPTASMSASNTVLCQGDDVPIETIIANCSDTVSFNWYYDNVLISSGPENEFSTSMLNNNGYLKLIISCGSSCIYSDTTDSIFFEVTPISVDAGPDKFILDGEIIPLDGLGTGNALWSPGNSLTDPTTYTPTANPSSTTTYYLTVNNGACTKVDSVNVFVGEVITIYSGFSPNDDAINDKWVIKNSAQYPDMEVTIYDRSGQKVFQTTGYSTEDKWWDGTRNGKQLPVSTYFYVIDLKIGKDGIFKGPVNIIR